ncbi:hypothetical protein BH20ACT21_BH20ACT21_04190 [soil metagenome]
MLFGIDLVGKLLVSLGHLICGSPLLLELEDLLLENLHDYVSSLFFLLG